MRAFALGLSVLLLAACQTTGMRDRAGFIYPEACKGDLAHIEVKVEFLPPEKMPQEPDRIVYERVFVARKPPLVLVSTALGNGDREYAIWHARCHVVAGAWHP